MTPKIATCCYCGSRAALMLNKDRHELTCSGCGAPLHNLKRMPVDVYAAVPDGRSPKKRSKSSRKPKRYVSKKRKDKPRKRQRSILSIALEEAFDAIEDIFD